MPKKTGNGEYIVCSGYASGQCKEWVYRSNMGRDHVRCSKCKALFPRDRLTANQQKHYDNIAATEAKERPVPPALPPASSTDMDTTEPALDREALTAELLKVEGYLSMSTGLPEDVLAGLHFTKLRGRVDELRSLLSQQPKSEAEVDPATLASRLTKELTRTIEAGKAEERRIQKYESNIQDLLSQVRDARANIETCKQEKDAINSRAAEIGQQLSNLTSGAPPPIVKVAEVSPDAKDPTTALLAKQQAVFISLIKDLAAPEETKAALLAKLETECQATPMCIDLVNADGNKRAKTEQAAAAIAHAAAVKASAEAALAAASTAVQK